MANTDEQNDSITAEGRGCRAPDQQPTTASVTISQRSPPLPLYEKTGSVRARTPAAIIKTMAGIIITLADSIAPVNPATFSVPPPIITPRPIALFCTAVWIAVDGTV